MTKVAGQTKSYGQTKNISILGYTKFKIGMVGRKIYYFVKSFYMGIEEQYGRTGKYPKNA